MFQTSDSGERQEFSTGMQRDTQKGKARFDLLFPEILPYPKQMLTRFANLMTRGAEKYQERNWEMANTQEELGRYESSALRHMIQWLNNESDEDHAAAVMFNIMGAEYVNYRLSAESKLEEFNTTPKEQHRWDVHAESCECYLGICVDCGCTNEYQREASGVIVDETEEPEVPCTCEPSSLSCGRKCMCRMHFLNEQEYLRAVHELQEEAAQCEVKEQHRCSVHTSGFPTAFGTLKGV